MALDGMRLTFPTPNDIGRDLVFRARSVSVTHTTQTGLLSGGSSIIGLASTAAQDGTIQGQGKRQGAALDLGGGVHLTTVQFNSWEGSTDRWGDTDGSKWDAGGDPPLKQLQTLDNALRSIRVDSESPLTLEVGEYASSGVFDPITAAPREAGLSFDVDEQASEFSGELQLVDVLSLQQAIDATQTTG